MVYALLSLSKKHAECHIIPVRGYTSLKVLVFFLHHPFRAVGISGEGASSNVLGVHNLTLTDFRMKCVIIITSNSEFH